MNHTLRVSRAQPLGNFNSETSDRLNIQRFSGDAVLQRSAIKMLHGNKRFIIVVSNFIDGADVGMI